MNKPIYLDYAATTPVDEDVIEKMVPFFTENFGNAGSSTHQFGWFANGAIKRARKQIASSINCEESEIIFTSGATESANIAIQGVFNLYASKGNHIIISKTEHKAVLDTVNFLKKKGARITYLDVDNNGLINLEELKSSICNETILIAVMWVNNETGVIQDAEEISNIAYQNKIPFLCDGAQALGKLSINMTENHIGLMPLSSHKIFGPKGVGALFIRRKNPRITLEPLIHGGGQEKGFRSGTMNVPGVVGFGLAAEKGGNQVIENQKRIKNIKFQFIEFFNQYEGIINGNTKACNHILNIRIPNLKASELIKKTRNIGYSLGSACNSDDLSPSHVLVAMGLSVSECESSFRLSFSHHTTDEEIRQSCNIFQEALQ